ncbi:MAG TPA: hypothetical protein VFC00_34995 [Micromonosporaceae bacterium]|nr:hypothetical protein [Micromonosporaceae bacterium]
MRALRSLAALAVAGGTVLMGAAPAHAVDVFVEVNPNTIQAGYAVVIRASCGDSVNPGTVKSDAFGEVTLVHQYGFLTATVTVPTNTRPRGYTVKLTCPTGSSATTTLWVVGMPAPTRGPHTGGGWLAVGGGSDRGLGGMTLVGGGLVVVGVGAGLGLLLRRRRAGAAR